MSSSNEDLALGLAPRRPGYSRSSEAYSLVTEVANLARDFLSNADEDALTLPTGHGLQIPGGGPRTVLVERHAPQKLASLLNLKIDSQGIVGKNASSKKGGEDESKILSENANDFRDVAKQIIDYSVNTSTPGFMEKLYSSPSPPSLAGDLLLSTLNTGTHVFSCSPALTLVEKFMGVQLASLFGLTRREGGNKSGPDPNAGGVTFPGGSAANTTAMLVARNVRFPQVKEHGLSVLPAPLAIFVSASAHYSAVTAAQMLGLGSKAVKKVPTLPDDSIDPAALETSIQETIRLGHIPFMVIGTSGTTVRGAYDDLTALGQISRKYGAWFHIDACWGGAAIFSEKLRYKLKGSELADSIAFNPHKMMGVVQTCNFLLGRDLRTFWVASRLEAGYLFHGDGDKATAVNGVDSSKDTELKKQRHHDDDDDDDDETNPDWRNSRWIKEAPNADTVFDLAQFTPQCGRRTEALKLYMHWRYYGTDGIARQVEASFAGARRLMQLVEEHAALRAVAPGEPPCAQACFYYCGQSGRIGMHKDVTRAIAHRLESRGWLTDYAPGASRGDEFLRVVSNRLTTEGVAEGLIKAVVEAGREVEKELGL